MDKTTVARRYATALFQLLEPLAVPTVEEGLQTVSKWVADSPALKHVLDSPVFTFEEKNAVLTELNQRQGFSLVLGEFWSQLIRKNRMSLLPEISASFTKLAQQEKGLQQVSVVSGKELTTQEQHRLEEKIQHSLHRDVEMTFTTNPTFLAGLKIQIGSRVFDSTVRGRLRSMGALLAKG